MIQNRRSRKHRDAGALKNVAQSLLDLIDYLCSQCPGRQCSRGHMRRPLPEARPELIGRGSSFEALLNNQQSLCLMIILNRIMGTYRELLDLIGISHTMFIVLLVVLFFLLSIFMFFSKLGFLTSIKFKTVTLPPAKVVYTRYEGSYDLINTKVQEVLQDTNTVFKISSLFGIYYQKENEADLDKQQAAIGVLVEPIEYEKIPVLQAKFPNKYRRAELPATQCVGTRYPYFNSASLIMIVNRVYPRLAQFTKQKRVQVGPGIMEIYKLLDKSPHVEILAPMENMESFLLK